MASEFFGRQCECCFYTVGCGNKMAVSVTGPRLANELGGPVILGSPLHSVFRFEFLLRPYIEQKRLFFDSFFKTFIYNMYSVRDT